MAYETEIRERKIAVYDSKGYPLFDKRIRCLDNYLEIKFLAQNNGIYVTIHGNFEGKDLNLKYPDTKFETNGITVKGKATKYCEEIEAEFIGEQMTVLKSKGIEAKIVKEPWVIIDNYKTEAEKSVADEKVGKFTKYLSENFLKSSN